MHWTGFSTSDIHLTASPVGAYVSPDMILKLNMKGSWKLSRRRTFSYINRISNRRSRQWRHFGDWTFRGKRLGHLIVEHNSGSINNTSCATRVRFTGTRIREKRSLTLHPQCQRRRTKTQQKYVWIISIHPISRQILFRHLSPSSWRGEAVICPWGQRTSRPYRKNKCANCHSPFSQTKSTNPQPFPHHLWSSRMSQSLSSNQGKLLLA